MGEVAVLQAHDVLKRRVSNRQSYVQPIRSDRNYYPTPESNPNVTKNNNSRRKRSPQKNVTGGGRSANSSSSPPAKNRHLVVGEVKILKRGEPLTTTVKASRGGGGVVEDLVLSSTDRLGPEPDMVPKQVRIADFYAGSTVVSSPPPSDLPVPAFFFKKKIVVDDATSDLRRLLRLDLC